MRRALCVSAAAGVGFLGVVILLLSLFWTQYSPITQVASDYGVGAYAAEMNSGFFLAGIGMASLGLVVFLSQERRMAKAGGVLLFPGAVALALNAFYQTDIEGAAKTLHGLIHGLDGALFFFTAPVALLPISYPLGRKRFGLTLVGFILVIGWFIGSSTLAVNAAGLGERLLIGVAFTSSILIAVRILRET